MLPRNRSTASRKPSFELLEDRLTPAVSVLFDTLTGGLFVDILSKDTAKLFVSGGRIVVQDSTGADVSGTIIGPSSVTSITVSGSSSDDTIDLSALNKPTDFPNASFIGLFGNGGNDLILGAQTYGSVPTDQFIQGGDGNDTLVGGDADDVIAGETGDDLLRGLTGYDEYFYSSDGPADWGADVIEEVQDDRNELNFDGIDVMLTWELNSTLGEPTQFANRLTFDPAFFNDFEGGSGDDYFIINGQFSSSIDLDGGSGNNILDYSNYDLAVAVDANAGTATGFASIQFIQGVVPSSRASTTVDGVDLVPSFGMTPAVTSISNASTSTHPQPLGTANDGPSSSSSSTSDSTDESERSRESSGGGDAQGVLVHSSEQVPADAEVAPPDPPLVVDPLSDSLDLEEVDAEPRS